MHKGVTKLNLLISKAQSLSAHVEDRSHQLNEVRPPLLLID